MHFAITENKKRRFKKFKLFNLTNSVLSVELFCSALSTQDAVMINFTKPTPRYRSTLWEPFFDVNNYLSALSRDPLSPSFRYVMLAVLYTCAECAVVANLHVNECSAVENIFA